MIQTASDSLLFQRGIEKLGFLTEEILFITDDFNALKENRKHYFLLEEAGRFNASAVFTLPHLKETQKPIIYFFDYTDKCMDDQAVLNLKRLQNQLWSSGKALLAIFFFQDDFLIVNCTQRIEKEQSFRTLNSAVFTTNSEHNLAIQLKTGSIWAIPEFDLNKNHALEFELVKELNEFEDFIEKIHPNFTLIERKAIIESFLLLFYCTRYFRGEKNSNYSIFTSFQEIVEVFKRNEFVEMISSLQEFLKADFITEKAEALKANPLLEQQKIAEFLSKKSSFYDTIFPEFVEEEVLFKILEKVGEQPIVEIYEIPLFAQKMLVEESFPLKFQTIEKIEDAKILDAVCNSSINLLLLYKQVIRYWRRENEFKIPSLQDVSRLSECLNGVFETEESFLRTKFGFKITAFNCSKDTSIETFNNIHPSNSILSVSDFLDWEFSPEESFDYIIANPLFYNRNNGELEEVWEVKWKKTTVPKGHISLNYLPRIFQRLKPTGTSCVLLNGLDVFYKQPSPDYNEILLLKHNIFKVYNFSFLTQDWKNDEKEPSLPLFGIFARNEKPDCCMNFLHLILKNTPLTAAQLFFESDSYDSHFINKQTEVYNPNIWQIDLLGGGKLREIITKLKSLKSTYEELEDISSSIIKNDIEIQFTPFSNEIVFNSDEIKNEKLNILWSILNQNAKRYSIYLSSTNYKLLFNQNFKLKTSDLLALPYIDSSDIFTEKESKLVDDCFHYFAKSQWDTNPSFLKCISSEELKESIESFSHLFLEEINSLYGDSSVKFRLSEVCSTPSNIAVTYRYSSDKIVTHYKKEKSLTNNELYSKFGLNRLLSKDKIIRLYPNAETIVLIKPNRVNYWNYLAAFQDAKKYF